MLGRAAHIEPEEIEQVVDRAALDRERAVHEGLAEGQPRIEEEFALDRSIVKSHGNNGAGRARKDMERATCVDQAQCAVANQMMKEMREEHLLASRFARLFASDVKYYLQNPAPYKALFGTIGPAGSFTAFPAAWVRKAGEKHGRVRRFPLASAGGRAQ